MPDAAATLYPSYLLIKAPFSWGLSRSRSPTLPSRTPSSISSAGITAAGTQLLEGPDCKLNYQTKAEIFLQRKL